MAFIGTLSPTCYLVIPVVQEDYWGLMTQCTPIILFVGKYLKSSAAADVNRRIIISQDLDEIYITIGEYDDEYTEYIQGQKSTNQGPPPASSSSDSDSSSEQLAGDDDDGLSDSPPSAPQTPLPQRVRQDPAAPVTPQHGLSARSASPSASGTSAHSAGGHGIDNSRKSSSESRASSGSIDSSNGFLIM